MQHSRREPLCQVRLEASQESQRDQFLDGHSLNDQFLTKSQPINWKFKRAPEVEAPQQIGVIYQLSQENHQEENL